MSSTENKTKKPFKIKPYLVFALFGFLVFCLFVPGAFWLQSIRCGEGCLSYGIGDLSKMVWLTSMVVAVIYGGLALANFENAGAARSNQEKAKSLPHKLLLVFRFIIIICIPFIVYAFDQNYFVRMDGVVFPDGQMKRWEDVRFVQVGCRHETSYGRTARSKYWRITYTLIYADNMRLDIGKMSGLAETLPRVVAALKSANPSFEYSIENIPPSCDAPMLNFIRQRP